MTLRTTVLLGALAALSPVGVFASAPHAEGERLVFNAFLPRRGGVLEEDRDFFPDEYLDALARQGMTGVCVPAPLRLVANTTLTPRTAEGEARLARLKRAAAKCARRGIRLWIYGNEPARFKPGDPLLKAHPELGGAFFPTHGSTMWCPCEPSVLAYMEEAMRDLFTQIPELGGFLNIAYGEGLTTCLDALECCPIEKYWAKPCARCAQRPVWQGYREMSEAIVRGIRASGSRARYLSWFYQPMATPERADFVAACAAHAPEGTTFLFNFESGALVDQLGKTRVCGDYSLAIPGPGKPFADVAAAARPRDVRLGAKIQTACSHELATIPDLPVPGILYRKYAALAACGVTDVLQGWSMGGEPGLMLRSATKLSAWDFSRTEDEFLKDLAAAEWGDAAEAAALVWKRCSDAFARYPVEHVIQYLGPFHAGIAWNLFALPEAGNILPAWKGFAETNGDRVGECLGAFSIGEVERLTGEMVALCEARGDRSQSTEDLLKKLDEAAGKDPERRRQLAMMRAFRLQIQSAHAVIGFYRRRSDAIEASRVRGDLVTARRLLDEMRGIVREQTRRAQELLPLAQAYGRLGYHADARKHIYSPEILARQLPRLERTLADLKSIRAELAAGRPWPLSARERTAPQVKVGGTMRTGGVTWKIDDAKGDLVVTGTCPAACPGLAFVFSDAAGAGFPVVCHIAKPGTGEGVFELRPTRGTCKASAQRTADGWTFTLRYPESAWKARGLGRPEWMTLFADTYPMTNGGVPPLWPENQPVVRHRGDLPWVDGAAFGRIVGN